MAGFRTYFDFKNSKFSYQNGSIIELSQDESRHLCGSLRAKNGDNVDAFDLNGSVWRCKIISDSPKKAQLELLERLKISNPKIKIYVAQCLPKGKVFDDILRQAVEVGASGIIPILSQHSQVKIDSSDVSKKLSKWESQVIEAVKQSANFFKFEVFEPVSFKKFIELSSDIDLKIVASLQQKAKPILETLKESNDSIKSLCILTGPEGDMSDQEYELADSSGFLPVILGHNVMKSETAALCSLSICNAYFNL